MRPFLTALFVVMGMPFFLLAAEPARRAAPMPVYVTPFYNSQGPRVEVGRFSKELTNANAATIRELAATLKKDWDTLPAETMYVLSIRLYDLGLKDEAVYWFYSAQWRGRVFSGLLDPEVVGTIGSPGFERIHAYGAFQQLAGTYINGYAFGDIPKLLKTLAVVREENERLPDYQAMHPHLKFIPDGAWPEKNRVMAEGFDRLVRQIEETADEIKATRQRNGMEGRF